MLHINTIHVQRETLWVKQLAGEQYKMICSAWACKHTYIAESFVVLCTHSSVWKVSSAHRGECVTTGGLYRPTHLCVAHFELHKKVHSFFFGVVRLGGGGCLFIWLGVSRFYHDSLSCWLFYFASCFKIQTNFPIIKTKPFKVTKY